MEYFRKYKDAIQIHIPWIKEQIGKEKNGILRIKIQDMAKEMGEEFKNKHPTSIYWGIKFVLFQEGIVVKPGVLKSDDKILSMRFATPQDKLPPSLSKLLPAKNMIKIGNSFIELISQNEVDIKHRRKQKHKKYRHRPNFDEILLNIYENIRYDYPELQPYFDLMKDTKDNPLSKLTLEKYKKERPELVSLIKEIETRKDNMLREILKTNQNKDVRCKILNELTRDIDTILTKKHLSEFNCRIENE